MDYPECNIYLKLTKKPITFHWSNYWQHPVSTQYQFWELSH